MRYVFSGLNALLLTFLVGGTYFVFESLPKRIPVHFGPFGEPDGWSDKGGLWTFILVGVILNVVLYTLVFLQPILKKYPRLYNFSRKDQLMALPAERQKIFWARAQEFLTALTFGINLIWSIITWGTIRIANGQMEKLPALALLGSILFAISLMIIYHFRLKSTVTSLLE